MIDPTLNVPWLPVFLFDLKRIFFLDIWPLAVGFVTIFCYQIYGRIGSMGSRNKLLVFLVSSTASMTTLFGWATIIRSAQMIPLYGCGVGFASVLTSQIYGVTLPKHRFLRIPLPKVIWRSDHAAILQFQRSMAEALAAKSSPKTSS
ncbi:MAG: hypothetical protein JO307_25875 [Bryobacterales bacterium]|nr:hypothetical protein [Bryobacterales bacterium]MBV9397822.1 hypothetical protein [Bryobacterales bacterium]